MARKALPLALVVLVAVLTPPVLVVTGFRVLAHEWYVGWEYDRPGFPDDRFGLSRDERERLALLGLTAITPGTEGVAVLERARLPDGRRAFDGKELAHMQDVRTLLRRAFWFQALAVVAIVTSAVLARRGAARRSVPLGLALGAATTLLAALVAIPVILLGFDGLFVGFHELFFAGDSWRFSPSDTLLRLYPERFWQDTARLVALIAVAQAIVLAPAAWWWARRAGKARTA